MKQYIQKNQDFNFFEIEHYFGHEYLRSKGMIKEETLHDVYEIVESKKSSFLNTVMQETNPAVFRFFVDLFKKIDQIAGVSIDYDEGV